MFWTRRLKYPFLVITALFVIAYALWTAIPTDHQKNILSRLIPLTTPSPSPSLMTESPSRVQRGDQPPNLPVIILNNYIIEKGAEKSLLQNVDNPDFAPVSARPNNSDCTKSISIPSVPAFNIFPINYEGTTDCFDLPLLRMRKLNGQYPKKDSEMRNGISASAGEELFGAIWVNNGAADNEELLSQTTARDVRMSATISSEISTQHKVTVIISALNADGIKQEFLVNTRADERLEFTPNSGERFDAEFNLTAANFQMGNNILGIGDIRPGFHYAAYFRFRVKVVSAANY